MYYVYCLLWPSSICIWILVIGYSLYYSQSFGVRVLIMVNEMCPNSKANNSNDSNDGQSNPGGDFEDGVKRLDEVNIRSYHQLTGGYGDKADNEHATGKQMPIVNEFHISCLGHVFCSILIHGVHAQE